MRYERYKISDLLSDISMGPFGSNIKVECFVKSGIPVLNGSNLDGFKLKEESFKYVTEDKANSLSRANAKRGDIVITHRGTLGQIVYIPQNSKYNRYVISQSQFRAHCNDKVIPEYLVYYFHSTEGRFKLLSNTSQVGVPALARPSSTFQNIEIDIPTVPMQKAIVEVLSAFDNKIELNNRINQKLEEMAQAIFKSWFVDFEPFRDAEFVESELGPIPKGWSFKSLSECCSTITRGITPKYDENTNQIVINQKCIRNHEVNLAPARRHKPKAITDKWLKYGDVLVNSTGQGTLGRTAQWFGTQKNITVDSHVTIVRPVDSSLVCFLGQLIMSREIEIENMASGSTGQTELSRERLGSMCIIVPDTVSLQKFSAIVQPLMNAAIYRNEETIRLSKIRDILLPKLISGDIPVQVGTD